MLRQGTARHPRLSVQAVVEVSTLPVAEQVMLVHPPYAELHVGWHAAPAAKLLVHIPRAPLVGAVTTHGTKDGAYIGATVDAALVGVGAGVGILVGATVVGEQLFDGHQ